MPTRTRRSVPWAAALAALVLSLVPVAAEAQLEKARELLRSGQYADAEKTLAPLAGKSGEARLLLGRVQLETGRYDEASRSARSARGKALKASAKLLEGEALLKVGRVDDAARALRAAVEAAGSGGDETEWRSRVYLGRALARKGDLLGARAVWDGLADDYNADRVAEGDGAGLWAVATAVAALEYWHDANDTFAAATKADRGRVETQLDWARLFLAKYDPGHAEECLRDALKTNPRHAEAHALMAQVRLRQSLDFVRANEEIDAALETNPSLAEAYAFRATIHVRDRLWERALEDVDRALGIDPGSPYALSVRAAIHYVADDRRDFSKTVERLRRHNPRFTDHVPVLTDLLEWEHRYDEIVEVNRKALEVNPGYWAGQGHVGLNLLRMGEDEEGLAALRASFEQDQFNVMVYNTLTLYEEVLSKQYSYSRHGPLRFRFHEDDREVLERYLPSLLERGYRAMSKRYGVRPRGTTVEVFASQDHFARRSVGLPRVGVQGICFGKVVVAAGPRAVPVNYGQVLWHELGHVFSIQLSRSRVPRWLTEGLAVLEESRGAPHWGREDDAALYRWVKAGRMPEVSALNTAFSRAKSGAEINLAYYGSAKLTAFIEDRYGFPKVLRMLRLYGQGKRTPEVVRAALGATPEEVDRGFRQHVEKTLGRAYGKSFVVDYGWYYDRERLEKAAASSPTKADALGRAAVAALAARDPGAAMAHAAKAIKLDPAEPRARHVLSDIAAAKGDWRAVREHAGALISRGVDGYALRLNLATAAEKTGDQARALRELEAAAKLDPQQVEPLARLAKLHLDSGKSVKALEYLRRAADLDQHARGLHRELVEQAAKAGRWDDVRVYGERALWLDPFNPTLHMRLARALAKAGDLRRAGFEYQSALLCKSAKKTAVHLAAAKMYREVGQKARAVKAARAALAEDSSNEKAKRLLEELRR